MKLSPKELEMLQNARRERFSVTVASGRKRTGGRVPSTGRAESKRAMKLVNLGLIEHLHTDTYRDTGGGYTTFYVTHDFRLTEKGKELLK